MGERFVLFPVKHKNAALLTGKQESSNGNPLQNWFMKQSARHKTYAPLPYTGKDRTNY
jgi:hypothetical protein